MTLYIQLTSAGTDVGPFNLYSNLSGVPFAVGVAKSTLLAGANYTTVPDGTTVVQIESSGVCENSIYITVDATTTTTTTEQISTTTTTTTLVTYPIFFDGLYTEGDPVHPDGGTLIYIDAFGIQQEISFIYMVGSCTPVFVSSVVSNVGVNTACT